MSSDDFSTAESKELKDAIEELVKAEEAFTKAKERVQKARKAAASAIENRICSCEDEAECPNYHPNEDVEEAFTRFPQES